MIFTNFKINKFPLSLILLFATFYKSIQAKISTLTTKATQLFILIEIKKFIG